MVAGVTPPPPPPLPLDPLVNWNAEKIGAKIDVLDAARREKIRSLADRLRLLNQAGRETQVPARRPGLFLPLFAAIFLGVSLGLPLAWAIDEWRVDALYGADDFPALPGPTDWPFSPEPEGNPA